MRGAHGVLPSTGGCPGYKRPSHPHPHSLQTRQRRLLWPQRRARVRPAVPQRSGSHMAGAALDCGPPLAHHSGWVHDRRGTEEPLQFSIALCGDHLSPFPSLSPQLEPTTLPQTGSPSLQLEGTCGVSAELLPSCPVQTRWPRFFCPHRDSTSTGLCVAGCLASLNEAFVGESRQGEAPAQVFPCSSCSS